MNSKKNTHYKNFTYKDLQTICPPDSDDEMVRWLQLKRSPRVGAQTFFHLLNEYGSAEEALIALPDFFQKTGMKNYTPANPLDAEREYRVGQRMGAHLITIASPSYPASLYDLDTPPPLFWAKGRIEAFNKPIIGMVGMRNASSLGMRTAEHIAQNLGEKGCAVISGLARGIDTAAHRGALINATIGVLASGIDNIYPAQNTDLAQKICKTGLIISEMPLGHAPIGANFPMRNRLIAALSRCVVVIEAASKSGSLMTAHMALDIGRDICAVPSHPFDERSTGTNNLIRDGAYLIRSADDIIAHIDMNSLSPPIVPCPTTPSKAFAAPKVLQKQYFSEEAPAPFTFAPPNKRAPLAHDTLSISDRILRHLSITPIYEDQLLRDLNLSHKNIAQSLLELELNGTIIREAGGLIARKTS